MTAYIVDNSVWWSAGRSSAIATRLRQVATRDLILTCPPQVLEYCFSAETPADHDEYRTDMLQYLPAEEHPDEDMSLEIQSALWQGGFVRGAGPVDVLIAAYAIVNDATVLTTDHDFDHIAAVVPDFRHEYVPQA